MTPVETLLAKLPSAKRTGGGRSAKCPAHNDSDPSLSISEGHDGRALVKRHAGCTVEAITAALGFTVRDLMPEKAGTTPLRTVKPAERKTPEFSSVKAAVAQMTRAYGPHSIMWKYQKADGQIVGLVARFERPGGKKTFRPVSAFPDGWRIKAMPGARPLYRLPELAAAARVYLTEGEKAADAAKALGLTATTSAGGSGAPGLTDWRPLAGKEVVILPDYDAPGLQYAAEVEAILGKLTPAPTVKVVELPGLPDGGASWTGSTAMATRPSRRTWAGKWKPWWRRPSPRLLTRTTRRRPASTRSRWKPSPSRSAAS